MSNEISLEQLKQLQNRSEITYEDILEFTLATDEYNSARSDHFVFRLLHGDDDELTYGESGQYVRGRLATAEKRMYGNSFYKTLPKNL